MIMTQENVKVPVTSGVEISTATAATSQVAPKGRALVMIVELLLIIILAYLVVNTFYAYITPRPDFTAAAQADASVKTASARQVSYDTIVGFDPFYRETQTATPLSRAVPESSLDIVIAGLRANADGKGAAILDIQGNGQKLVSLGDEISPGIKLSQIFVDRIEINRRGVRETVYMTKPSGVVSSPQNNINTSKAALKGISTEPARSNDLSAVLTRIQLEPVRDGSSRRFKGFRVTEGTPQPLLLAAGLEVGDVILAVNGSPLTSFERMQELGEELQFETSITIDIERRGQQIALTL